MSTTKLVVIPEELHEYLTEHIFRRTMNAGLIPPEELRAAAEVWGCLKNAQAIDYSKLDGVEVNSISPNKVDLEIT